MLGALLKKIIPSHILLQLIRSFLLFLHASFYIFSTYAPTFSILVIFSFYQYVCLFTCYVLHMFYPTSFRIPSIRASSPSHLCMTHCSPNKLTYFLKDCYFYSLHVYRSNNQQRSLRVLGSKHYIEWTYYFLFNVLHTRYTLGWVNIF